jgi:hypothetical protein
MKIIAGDPARLMHVREIKLERTAGFFSEAAPIVSARGIRMSRIF